MHKGLRAVMLYLSLAALTLFCLTGCQNKTKAYKEALSAKIQEVKDMETDINTAVSGLQTAITNADETSYSQFLDLLEGYCGQLKSKYTEIADLEAPEEYADQQQQLKTYAADICTMLDESMELYQIAGKAFSRELTASETSRMEELQTDIPVLTASASAFEEVLGEILDSGSSS